MGAAPDGTESRPGVRTDLLRSAPATRRDYSFQRTCGMGKSAPKAHRLLEVPGGNRTRGPKSPPSDQVP